MKKVILTCLFPLLIVISPVLAQVKKATTQSKPTTSANPKTAAVKIPVLNKLDPFTKMTDDLVQFLNDEFKKLGLTLNDIDETTIHQYDGTKQLDGVFSTTRELTFTNGVSSTIFADGSDKVTELEIELAATDTINYKAIKLMLAFTAWAIIEKNDTDTTYKHGNSIAYTAIDDAYNAGGDKKGKLYYLSIKKITPYIYQPNAPVLFNAKALTNKDNSEDVGYSAVKLLEGLGFGLLYKEAEKPIAAGNKLIGYSTYYQFNNAVSAQIQTTPFRKLKMIDIDADDPISFLKIKKALGISGWKMYNSDAETKTEFYEYNNLRCMVTGDMKDVTFTITPERNDVIARLEDTDIPSLDDLMNLYHSGTKEQVLATIADRYVNDFYVTDTPKPMTFEPSTLGKNGFFLIRTDDGKVPARVNFNFSLELPDAVIALNMESKDSAYLKRISEEFKTSKHNVKYQCELNADKNGNLYGLYVEDRDLNKKRDAIRGIR